MEMQEDALKLIQDTAVKAEQLEMESPEQEPDHVYYVYNPASGKIEWREAKPAPRRYPIHTLEALLAAIKHFDGPEPDGDVAVFVGEGAVTAILDEQSCRRERLRWFSPKTGPAEKLGELAAHDNWYAQAEFLSLLRIDLADCVVAATVELFRNLKFTKGETGEMQLTNSRQALGKQIEATLAAGGSGAEIPEEITLLIPVYEKLADMDQRQTVKCALVADLAEGQFLLKPLAGEMVKAEQQTDAWIVKHLQDQLQGVAKVFAGSAT